VHPLYSTKEATVSGDLHRLVWQLAVLAAVLCLFFAHAPEALIGYLLALLQNELGRKPRTR
jgi:hypothetical protein